LDIVLTIIGIALATLIIGFVVGRRRLRQPPEPRWSSAAQSPARQERLPAVPEAPPATSGPEWSSPALDIDQPDDQLAAVARSTFRTRTILNKDEYRVFKIVENEVRTLRLGYRAFAQVSLGEILACSDRNAYRWINSKRADIVVVDAFGNPVAAVEYQGEGHDQGNAPTRDAVKRTALRRAGVAYVEVLPEHSADDVRSLLLIALKIVADPSAAARRQSSPDDPVA